MRLIPKCQPGKVILSTKYPTVTYKEEPWAEEFFNNNPHVASMERMVQMALEEL